MDAPRRRYSVEELRALRDRAPPLPLEAILHLGTASRSHHRHREPSPPRPPSPNLVPVDDSWLRPHPLLGDLDASLEPARSPPRHLKQLKQPKQLSTPPPGFGPAPGFGPVPAHPPVHVQRPTRTNAVKPTRAPSPPAAAYKSRIARGPDLSRNFASRIAFRDKASRKTPSSPGVFKSVPTQHPLVTKTQKQTESESAGTGSATLLKPVTFVPIEACHTSAEIDRLFAAPSPSSPPIRHSTAQISQSHLPQPLYTKPSRPTSSEQPSDALARWFLDLSTHTSTAPTAYSSEADKKAQLDAAKEAEAVAAPQSEQKGQSLSPAADQPLAPNVLSFFDSIRAQATTVGRKTNIAPASGTGMSAPLPVSPAPNPVPSRTYSRPEPIPQAAKPRKRDDGIDSESVRNFFDMFSSTQSTNGRALPNTMAQPSSQTRGPSRVAESAEIPILQSLMHSGLQTRNQPFSRSFPQSHLLPHSDVTSHSQAASYSQAMPQSRLPQMQGAPAYPQMMYHAQHSRPAAHPHAAQHAPTHSHAQPTQAHRVLPHNAPRQDPSASAPMHGARGPFVVPHQAHAHGMHLHNMSQRAHTAIQRHPGQPGQSLHQQHNQMQHMSHLQHLQQRQNPQPASRVPNGGMARFQHVPQQHAGKTMPVPIAMAAATAAAGGAAATPPRSDTGDLQRWFAALSDANQTR